ncbi:MAG: transposase [Candidatus Thiodiazotropha sp. (ex Cardiolucina cf. quadrata)]|nr:transposase [Candidatus Thiodiazotropha sp. (ex Cardiolucina cf. quadrata)]
MIVSKLSTYRRQNSTNKALWEFDNIIKSLYLLDYVDPPILRSNVHNELNRGEACIGCGAPSPMHPSIKIQPLK